MHVPLAWPAPLVALAVLAGAWQAEVPSFADAEAMAGKLRAIMSAGELPRVPGSDPVRTSFLERELNAYFAYMPAEQLPVGLVAPSVGIEDDGQLRGRAWVNLDTVRAQKERGLFDPLRWISGTLEVNVTATLRASNGTGRLTLHEAKVGGVTVPESLIQELVTYYTRTPEKPDGFDLNEPFEMPVGILEITTTRSRATIVQ